MAVISATMSPDLSDRFEREALPHSVSLYQSAVRLTRHTQDAEDLVQETMTRACAGFGRFKPDTNIRAWLQRIMMNIFISGYRKRHREPFLVVIPADNMPQTQRPGYAGDHALSAEDEAISALPATQIFQALRDLSPDFRHVVYLIDVEGFSYAETAQLMGTPLGTVMSRLHRGRRQLRAQVNAVANN